MTVTAPLEVGVSVRDAVKPAEYYTDVLGFTKISEIRTPAGDESPDRGVP